MSYLGLAVDRASELPFGTQLIWKLRTLIATGSLAPGDRLPALREVAEAAGVNVNTVRSVFTRLEEQGLLRSEQGRGTFVTADARRESLLAELAQTAIEQATEAGIDPRELAAALYVSPTPVPRSDPARERRQLRAEIAELEAEFAVLEPLGTLEPRRDSRAARLLSAAELREIRDQLRDRIAEQRRERALWAAEREELAAAEQRERERDDAGREPARWRDAGVWTGRPTRVSWTAP